MSVWQRQWGEIIGYDENREPIRKKKAWVADYFDANGKRRIKTFKKHADAVAFESKTRVEVKEGRHVADSDSITVGKAGDNWLKHCEERELVSSTLSQYRQHVELHIKPFLADVLLTKLTVPRVRQFLDELHENGRSPAMVKAVRTSLSSLISEALESGYVVANPVRDLSRTQGKKKDRRQEKKKLVVGIDLPTPAEVKLLGQKAKGLRAQVFVKVMPSTGLRASEFRGLEWKHLDLKGHQLDVRQMADEHNEIRGTPKSDAGYRTVPLLPDIVQLLREWEKECPKKDGKLWLVFPDAGGDVLWHQSGLLPVWWQAQLDAGVTAPELDDDGEPETDEGGNPVMAPKYTGLHSLRHFFASWCLNRERNGGRGLTWQETQEYMGHADVKTTINIYGHLFPKENDAKELAKAGKALFG